MRFPLASSQERVGIYLEKTIVSDVAIAPLGKADTVSSLLDKSGVEKENKILSDEYAKNGNSEKFDFNKISTELNNRRKNLLILLQILRGAK